MIYDITERKQAEERLREAEERYRTLVEQLPVAIYTDATDDLSTALYISPQYERLTGYTPEQRLMDPGLWVRMLYPDDRERVLVESNRTNETGDPFDVEYRVVRADGTITWLHDHAMVVAGPGGKRQWHGVLQERLLQRRFLWPGSSLNSRGRWLPDSRRAHPPTTGEGDCTTPVRAPLG